MARRVLYEECPRCSWGMEPSGGNTMDRLFLKFYVKFQELTSREDAQDLVEYALLLTMISLALVSGIKGITTTLINIFTNVSTSLV
jgi:pilus assembly protein Flp/PilA